MHREAFENNGIAYVLKTHTDEQTLLKKALQKYQFLEKAFTPIRKY